jgi:hypothetical protein
MRTAGKGTLALCLALLAVALLPGAALAAPTLGLELERTMTPLTHSDERLVYEIEVKNTASITPVVGDELSCDGVPPSKFWFFATEFEIEWYRNGEAIAGTKGPAATSDTYTLSAADEGKAIQCVVTGINPEAKVLVAEGVAEATTGSNVLRVRSKLGTGTLTAGSKEVTGVMTFQDGPFGPDFLVGQTITGPAGAIPAETTITAVDTGEKTLELSQPATASGTGVVIGAGAAPFAVGDLLFGPLGIQQGAEITAVNGQQVTISAPATGTIGAEYVYATDKPPVLRAAKGSIASQPPVVVAPVPATAPPAPISGTGRPDVPQGGENKRSCDAGEMNLSGDPAFAYQWLRDGVEIPGATSPEYQPGPADVGSILQCRVIASNAGGAMVGISHPAPDRVANPPTPVGSAPDVEFSNNLSGPLSLQMELPHSPETFVTQVSGTGWKCLKEQPSEAQSASATCTHSDSLPPGQSHPEIELVVRPGRDAPDTLTTKVTASGGGAPDPAIAEDSFEVGPAGVFGFKAFETNVEDPEGNEYFQAGGHPHAVGAHLAFNEHVRAIPSSFGAVVFRAVNGHARVIRTDAPPGFVGNPEAMAERCASIDDAIAKPSSCPAESAIGGIDVRTDAGLFEEVPIYAMQPERGQPAQFGFGVAATGHTFSLVPELRPQDGYAVTLISNPLAKNTALYEATVTLCGFGAKLVNKEGVGTETAFEGCRKADEAGATERPFLTLPTRCGDPASATTEIFADSWEDPGVYATESHTLTTPTGCDELEFDPELKARPTTNRADSPTGLDVSLHFPQNEANEGRATAHLKKAVVTLPEGLVVNPSGANGLGACTEAQLGMKGGVADNEPVRCPDSSKIGSVSVSTPILDHPLPGALYVATPHQNPFDSLIALYLVVESPQDGLVIKLAGKTEANPSTGQLTSTFDQNPRAPVEDVELKIRSGATAPLRTPTACAKYTVTSSMTPWSAPQSGPPATPKDSWQINRGPTGGACASSLPNTPSFEAGSASPIAATHSPFVVKLSREDGTQQFSQVTVSPPPGVLAKLAGTSRCSDASLAQAQTKSGKSEQSSPSCPASSELGTVVAAAGAGPSPFQATGKAYLAGPYKGAPLSIAIITPAVAGPFDLGVVVVRAAAYVDPATAQVTVRSDPLPQILEGIPLDIRSATVTIDRPDFILNPTSCDPMAVKGELLSALNQSASLESRFQAAECSRLAFKPKLALKLNGKTKRGDYQGLRATLSAKPGEANIASASVTLPRSAFLAQEHIRTVCTRVQFAADQCPKGSIYGKAKAVTPLLDEPLQGPVYLRSSSNKLPDLVVALKGPDSLPVEVELAGRTDSRKGALRNTFDLVPDAPVSKFTLELFGGKKGLVVNSRNLCAGVQRASVEMSAQNGKERSFRPVVGNGCSKGRKGKRKGHPRR